MIEYTIITVLSLAFIYQTLTKRHWKRRAEGKGFWGLVEKQMQTKLNEIVAEGSVRPVQATRSAEKPWLMDSVEWPDTLDDAR